MSKNNDVKQQMKFTRDDLNIHEKRSEAHVSSHRAMRKKAIVSWIFRLIFSILAVLFAVLVAFLIEDWIYWEYRDFYYGGGRVIEIFLAVASLLFVLISIVGLILTILKCPRCKKMLFNSNFCPRCGYKTKRYCSNCGKSLKADALFCHKCGKTIDQNDEE